MVKTCIAALPASVVSTLHAANGKVHRVKIDKMETQIIMLIRMKKGQNKIKII